MSFILLKKKRYKFQVDLTLEELSEVSYSKGILFAKIRQLDGGSFTDESKRMEVHNHRVQYSKRFVFPCKMNANASSGVLETCKCRISIRMEEKGGRHFRKLGFVDINLAEYAGAGPSTQRYILQPYDLSHRLDNSIVKVSINITLKEGDTIFQRPLTRQQPISVSGEEGSLTVVADEESSNNADLISRIGSHTSAPAAIVTSPAKGLPSNKGSLTVPAALSDNQTKSGGLFGTTPQLPQSSVPDSSLTNLSNHTRNSSATSQASAGYESQISGQQIAGSAGVVESHSRQSSSGGESSSHGRLPRSQTTIGAFERREYSSLLHRRARSDLDSVMRNMSQGSSDTGFFGGSLEKEKRRKQQKLDEGRIDAEKVINELMEGVDLEKVVHDEAETSGLQLYVSKDGSVTFDKRNSSKVDLQPVVIQGRIPGEPRYQSSNSLKNTK